MKSDKALTLFESGGGYVSGARSGDLCEAQVPVGKPTPEGGQRVYALFVGPESIAKHLAAKEAQDPWGDY